MEENVQISIPTAFEIKQHLDEYVIGNEEVKKTIAVAVHSHYKRIQAQLQKQQLPAEYQEVDIEKSNIILTGPTGSGKTLIAKTLAKFLGVPFAIADATTLTQAGYVGEDVENIVRYLYQNANKNIGLTQIGIIYIDEIDKIASKTQNVSLTRDVSGEGVQQSMLKIIEGTRCRFPENGGRKHPDQPLVEVDTSNILFICAGAFVGLDKIVKQRNNKNVIGFGADNSDKKEDRCSDIQPQDLVEFGLIPEFVGRLPIIAKTVELTEDDLIRIMTEPKNALIKQYSKLLYLDGIKLTVKKDALKSIAKAALERKTGARGLKAIFEKLLTDVIYEASQDKSVKEIVLNKKVVSEKLKLVK